MLDPDVDSLGDDSVPDLFVDDHSHCSGVYIENCSCPSVVVFVWHSLVDGSVHCNVNNISDLESGQGFRDVDGAVLAEPFFEFIPSFTLETVAVGHFLGW